MEVTPRGEWSPEALELAEQHHAGRQGSRNAYRRGCRCPECVEANRASRERERSSSSSSSSKAGSGKRAGKVAETIHEAVTLRRPELDTEGLSLLEVVDRDRQQLGEAIALIAEWLEPLGLLIDAVFGSPVVILMKLAPTIRAARRDLRVRREQRRAEAEAAAEVELGGEPGEDGRPLLPGLEAVQ
jgi:hypothetical protein